MVEGRQNTDLFQGSFSASVVHVEKQLETDFMPRPATFHLLRLDGGSVLVSLTLGLKKPRFLWNRPDRWKRPALFDYGPVHNVRIRACPCWQIGRWLGSWEFGCSELTLAGKEELHSVETFELQLLYVREHFDVQPQLKLDTMDQCSCVM